ncbi:MAG: hypothetical protein ACI9J5_003253 [Paraglaciecola sp.]|jgi:hypothetical protein
MANKGNGGHFDLLAPTRAELMQIITLMPKHSEDLLMTPANNSRQANSYNLDSCSVIGKYSIPFPT